MIFYSSRIPSQLNNQHKITVRTRCGSKGAVYLTISIPIHSLYSLPFEFVLLKMARTLCTNSLLPALQIHNTFHDNVASAALHRVLYSSAEYWHDFNVWTVFRTCTFRFKTDTNSRSVWSVCRTCTFRFKNDTNSRSVWSVCRTCTFQYATYINSRYVWAVCRTSTIWH
jgi:hypothetical protein